MPKFVIERETDPATAECNAKISSANCRLSRSDCD
jgi:hypothetical protein